MPPKREYVPRICEAADCERIFIPTAWKQVYCCRECNLRNRPSRNYYLPVIFVNEKERKARKAELEQRLGRKLTAKELRRL